MTIELSIYERPRGRIGVATATPFEHIGEFLTLEASTPESWALNGFVDLLRSSVGDLEFKYTTSSELWNIEVADGKVTFVGNELYLPGERVQCEVAELIPCLAAWKEALQSCSKG